VAAAAAGGTAVRRWDAAAPAAWALAGVAVLGALGLTIGAAVLSRTVPGLVGYVGGFGTTVLAVAIWFGTPALIGPSIAALAAAVALSLFGAGAVLRVDAVAAGMILYLVTEAAYRSLEWRHRLQVPPPVQARALGSVLAVALAGAAAGMALLVVAAGTGSGGAAVEGVGALAVLGVVAVYVGLVRRTA
jgi:hypothetical protein